MNLLLKESLKFDRLIDNEIYIGIVSQKGSNPLSTQAIRLCNNCNLKRLEKCIETENNLIFEYENNTTLNFYKRDKEIIINISDPDRKFKLITKMNMNLRNFFKPINFGNSSIEYDKIPSFISSKKNENN